MLEVMIPKKNIIIEKNALTCIRCAVGTRERARSRERSSVNQFITYLSLVALFAQNNDKCRKVLKKKCSPEWLSAQDAGSRTHLNFYNFSYSGKICFAETDMFHMSSKFSNQWTFLIRLSRPCYFKI